MQRQTNDNESLFDIHPMVLPSTWQVSVDAVRQLDRNLFEAYIERRADPIAGSLEPGIYAGYFDWRDCQTPTGSEEHSVPSLHEKRSAQFSSVIKTWDVRVREITHSNH